MSEKQEQFTPKRFKRRTAELFKTDEDYCVEIGTYLPIAKRVEDLKKAGMNLMAYRQAYAEFANGTENIDLDEYENELLNIDEIEFMEKKKQYFDIMKKAEKIQAEKIAELKKQQHEAEINAEVEKRINAQKSNS